MTKGLIIGKFYPPHVGHHYLIDSARDQCDELMVLVLWSRVETIAAASRAKWLQAEHRDIQVFMAQDEHPIDYSDEGWRKHVTVMEDTLLLHGFRPDILFSSESYGPELAERLNIPEHRYIDLDRESYPISGTLVRQDITTHWDFLSATVKAAMCKRVVICGAESTGTTTLAKQLAEHYNTACVPEYGRHFDWAVGKNHIWTPDDFDLIAKEQHRLENIMAQRTHNGILICDTDEFATAMFSEVYLTDNRHTSFRIAVEASKTLADLYIITDDQGVPFEDDGTRYNSGRRPWMTEWFKGNLPPGRTILVSGSRQDRFMRARMRCNILLDSFHFADPIGEVVNG